MSIYFVKIPSVRVEIRKEINILLLYPSDEVQQTFCHDHEASNSFFHVWFHFVDIQLFH